MEYVTKLYKQCVFKWFTSNCISIYRHFNKWDVFSLNSYFPACNRVGRGLVLDIPLPLFRRILVELNASFSLDTTAEKWKYFIFHTLASAAQLASIGKGLFFKINVSYLLEVLIWILRCVCINSPFFIIN